MQQDKPSVLYSLVAAEGALPRGIDFDTERARPDDPLETSALLGVVIGVGNGVLHRLRHSGCMKRKKNIL